ncbi:MAG: hypothetical protein QM764_08835 [Chitinophagaceae bacterium]
MKPYCLAIPLLALIIFAHSDAIAQDDDASKSEATISARYINKVTDHVSTVDRKLESYNAKALQQFQKHQERLWKKLNQVDSVGAKKIIADAQQRYKSFEQKLNDPKQLSQYIPLLDTLKTSLKFLSANNNLLTKAKNGTASVDQALGKVNGLENELQKADVIKQYLNQERQLLQQQLQNLGLVKQLKQFNKDVYYYSQQVNEYKQILKDPKRIERKTIELLSRTKLFQDFMHKNSLLASLFRLPSDDPNDPGYAQLANGLQTRSQVNQFIQNQLGSGGPAALQQVQGNIRQGSDMLQQLKNKVTQYGSSSDDVMPEGFKPSAQKTKSFFKRLEYGTNIQSQRAQYFFPATSDIALSVGYKLNNRSVIGIGAAYKLGLGNGWNHMQFSQQGAGLRSFIDWKFKGNFWITGGFEANYKTEFHKIDELKSLDAWQQSGLIGISKVVDVKSTFLKKTKLQLLWDFLSYQQMPRTQAVLFRIGYGFN